MARQSTSAGCRLPVPQGNVSKFYHPFIIEAIEGKGCIECVLALKNAMPTNPCQWKGSLLTNNTHLRFHNLIKKILETLLYIYSCSIL